MRKKSIILRVATISLAMFVGLTGWQFYTTAQKVDAARAQALRDWVAVSKERATFAALYSVACVKHAPVEKDQSKVVNRPLTYNECALQVAEQSAKQVGVNHQDVDAMIRLMDEAANMVAVPAPLRWL